MSRPPAPLPKARGDIVCTNQYALSYLSPWSQPSSVAEVAVGRSGKETVTIFAAASATNAMDEIKAEFARATGTEVRTSYASSSTLAQQIENGADADLFLSADMKWADHLEAKVPIARRRTLLGNRLVIVVPAVSKLALTRPTICSRTRCGISPWATRKLVPAGIYARQALTRLGVWEKLKDKVAAADDVRHALLYVETGAAEAGIVYATDAAVSKRVRVALELPAGLTDAIRYPLLLLKHTPEKQSATDFFDFLGSPEARRIFEKYGFTMIQ